MSSLSISFQRLEIFIRGTLAFGFRDGANPETAKQEDFGTPCGLAQAVGMKSLPATWVGFTGFKGSDVRTQPARASDPSLNNSPEATRYAQMPYGTNKKANPHRQS